MWVLLLLAATAIFSTGGKAGACLAAAASAIFFLSIAAGGTGMIIPWQTRKQTQYLWTDATADPEWRYLITARKIAQEWYFSRWNNRKLVYVGAILALLVALLAFIDGILELVLSFYPLCSTAIIGLKYSLLTAIVLGFGIFVTVGFGRNKTPPGISDTLGKLHGAGYLWAEWNNRCDTVPMPYVLWKYIRYLIPVASLGYHYFSPHNVNSAIIAVLGITMLYFAFVVTDVSFDTLAALNNIEFCPCRSIFLARLVREADFLRQGYKPLWAKIIELTGL